MSVRKVAIDYFDDALGRDWTQKAPVKWLLEVGRVAAPTDYAVVHYYDKRHPKFYRQRSVLEKALRHALSRPTFPDRVLRLERMADGTRHRFIDA